MRTYKWYLYNSYITNTQHRICPDIIVENYTLLLKIILKTNIFFLISMYWTSTFFVHKYDFYSFFQYTVPYCALISLLGLIVYLQKNITWSTIQQKMDSKPLFLSQIIEAEFIIMISLLYSSLPIMHSFCLYNFSDPSIAYILL